MVKILVNSDSKSTPSAQCDPIWVDGWLSRDQSAGGLSAVSRGVAHWQGALTCEDRRARYCTSYLNQALNANNTPSTFDNDFTSTQLIKDIYHTSMPTEF